MSDYVKLIESRLDQLMLSRNGLEESMRYSIVAGGKRIRQLLALEFCKICGGDIERALDAACAIEMVHTYSLIHDDLPCMDNDDLRRGKPTNHVIFGECTATLAGDALQSYAFETVLNCALDNDRKVNCASILAKAIGPEGMCLGQYLDMDGEGKNLSSVELDEINFHKTGDLIAASCMIGCASAGADNKIIEKAGEFGYKLGLAFQIRDDMLDVLSSKEELGKPIGSDAEENKNTYMVILGEKKCAELVHNLSCDALHILKTYFTDTEFLTDFVNSLETRTK